MDLLLPVDADDRLPFGEPFTIAQALERGVTERVLQRLTRRGVLRRVFRGVYVDSAADDDLLEVATALIEKKTDKFDPKIFKDHYQAALRELIQRKLKAKGRKIEVAEEKPSKQTGNVIDLMAALKKSLDSGARTPAKKATAKKVPAKKAAAKKAPARKKAS